MSLNSSLLATLIALLVCAQCASLHMKMVFFKKRTIAASLLSAGISLGGGSTAFAGDLKPSSWDPTVKYEVLKGNPGGQKTEVGDMVAIRFKGSYQGNVFDDTFVTEQPYFYRAGVGLILKGIDDAVVNMHIGERYHILFSGENSFLKQKPSAPGKPRIPAGAELDYEVELVELPGSSEEFIADVE